MLRSADGLMQLTKVQIDNFVNQDSYLQEFLTWASQKSFAVPLQPKVATVRAFYLALSRTPHITSQFSLASSLDQGIIFDTALDDLMNLCKGNEDVSHAYSCGIALDEILVSVLDAGLHKSLEKLYNQFPQHSSSSQRERFRLWWEEHYKGWVNELKLAIATHRNINHEWEFSLEQQQTLQCYYDANQLLLDCLRSNSQVTASVRTEIEANLLLPQLELEAKEWR
jgi:predicted NACHT family NTPase